MNVFFGQNLKFLRKTKGYNRDEMASSLGFTSSTLGNYEANYSKPKFDDLLRICQFFGISLTELVEMDLSLTEVNEKKTKKKNEDNAEVNVTLKPKDYKGEMDNNRNLPLQRAYNFGTPKVIVTDNQGIENIVHVPVKARAGYLSGYGDPEYIESLPTYRFPGLKNGTFRSFEVEGHSMKPTLLQRDYVVGEWVERLEDIRENRVHIIVTHSHGIVIKRVLNRLKERNKLYLKSDNITNKTEYPIIEVEPEDVKEIWYSRIRFTPDFSEPGEIYTRLNDLEILVNEIKNRLK